jgi:carbon monoxide dehydrogenase subunit G
MKMTGEQRIGAPIDAVWAALNDADVLRASIPGCQSLEPDGNNGFKAAATIKVGPISARFGGAVQLSDLDPPRSYRITGEGSGGAAGAAKGGALVRLEEVGNDTVLHYEVSADVTGRLAQLGGKLIDITAKQLAGVFFSRFSEEVLKRRIGDRTATAAATPAGMSPARPPAAPQPVALEPSVRHQGSAITILLVAAALALGFVLGRCTAGWDGAGALVGAAIALLILLVAGAAFLLGRFAGRAPTTVSLDAGSIAALAAALGKPGS